MTAIDARSPAGPPRVRKYTSPNTPTVLIVVSSK